MIYIFNNYCDIDITISDDISDGDLLFYAKECSNDILDRWFDGVELLNGIKVKVNTERLYQWFKDNNFTKINPNTWSKEQKLLFRLTWG